RGGTNHHRVREGQHRSCPHLHCLCAERHVEHLHRRVLLCARAAFPQSVLLHRLSHRHSVLWFVPGHFYGERGRRMGQREENCGGGPPPERHRPPRRHCRRRHRGRPLQRHLDRGAEPGDQIHHA